MRYRLAIPLLLVPLALSAGCNAPDAATGPALTPAFEQFALAPELPPPEDFVDPATDPNPYFPLVPGSVWKYMADSGDELELTVDSVLDETTLINPYGTGAAEDEIEATVLLDRVYLCEEGMTAEECQVDGFLIEETFDWYGQDAAGNVWYLGESSCEFEEPGDPCDPSGSWEAGVDGAEAGIIMWADPLAQKGKTYRQEYYEDAAEDMAKVLHGDLTVTVEAGTFTECIETMDFTPLEPGAREHKFWCAGIGMVLELSPSGGNVRNELVSYALATP